MPVAIDAEREVEGLDMFRATYFVVTTDVPASVWEIALPPLAPIQGLGALGLLGVVFGTIVRSPAPAQKEAAYGLFTQPEDVAAIFALEEEGPLSVQLEDVWLVKRWCVAAPTWGGGKPQRRDPARGDVFRVALDLFQRAYLYTAGDIDLDELVAADPGGRIFRSPDETRALTAWAAGLIEETRRAYPNKAVKLRRRRGSDG